MGDETMRRIVEGRSGLKPNEPVVVKDEEEKEQEEEEEENPLHDE